MDDNNIYLDVFFEETDTYLRTLNDDVLKLEKNPEDIEVLNAIFRSAHTLKGMAATMGYEKMATLTHQMENVFELLKNGEVTATHDTVTLIFNCFDTLSEIVEDLRAGGDGEIDVSALVDQLKVIGSGTDGSDEAGNQTANQTNLVANIENYSVANIKTIQEGNSLGYNGYIVAIQLSETSPMKGVRAFLILNDLKTNGQIVLVEPEEDKMEAEDYNGMIQVLFLTKLRKDEIVEMLTEESDVEAVVVEEALSILKDPEEEAKSAQEKKQTAPKKAIT